MISQTPYSTEIIPVEIELPEKLITFYSQRSIFDSSIPSYEHLCKDAKDLGNDCYNVFGLPIDDQIRIEYIKESSKRRANNYSKSMISKLFDVAPRFVDDINLFYMMNGRTVPIKITSDVDKNSSVSYAKKPSVARVFGNSLYNIISGHDEISFKFNQYVLLENETKGGMINDYNKSAFFNQNNFIKSAIVADLHDWFLCVNDLNNYRNFVVGPDYSVKLIDFDCMFFKGDEDMGLLDFLIEDGMNICYEGVEFIRKEEKKNIRRRIIRSRKHFDNLVDLMSSISEFNVQAKEMFGFKNVREFYESRIDDLSR